MQSKIKQKSRKTKKADGLSKLLSQENQQNELNDIFETDRQINAANIIKDIIKLKKMNQEENYYNKRREKE